MAVEVLLRLPHLDGDEGSRLDRGLEQLVREVAVFLPRFGNQSGEAVAHGVDGIRLGDDRRDYLQIVGHEVIFPSFGERHVSSPNVLPIPLS
ncbi:hypothetical protein NY08_3708 [Rhodococcus sp. B7740]|nr:hypothetical protein NY08_3708 [Rhodococcus sp. B7740]